MKEKNEAKEVKEVQAGTQPDAVEVLQAKLAGLQAQEANLNDAIQLLPTVQEEISKVEQAIAVLTGKFVAPRKVTRKYRKNKKARATKRGRKARRGKAKAKRGRPAAKRVYKKRAKMSKTGKRMGRPVGSKNRPKAVVAEAAKPVVPVVAPKVTGPAGEAAKNGVVTKHPVAA